MSINRVERIDERVEIRHVLVSVSDKRGLDEFVPELVRLNPGLRIFSTGGTFSHLEKSLGKDGGRNLTQVADYTGQGLPRSSFSPPRLFGLPTETQSNRKTQK